MIVCCDCVCSCPASGISGIRAVEFPAFLTMSKPQIPPSRSSAESTCREPAESPTPQHTEPVYRPLRPGVVSDRLNHFQNQQNNPISTVPLSTRENDKNIITSTETLPKGSKLFARSARSGGDGREVGSSQVMKERSGGTYKWIECRKPLRKR